MFPPSKRDQHVQPTNTLYIMSSYDLIVIGGGPAVYRCYPWSSTCKKVACVEMEHARGTCLNWGCIPTKALLKNAGYAQTLTKKSKEFGLSFENLQYDWSTVISRSRRFQPDWRRNWVPFQEKQSRLHSWNGLNRSRRKSGSDSGRWDQTDHNPLISS